MKAGEAEALQPLTHKEQPGLYSLGCSYKNLFSIISARQRFGFLWRKTPSPTGTRQDTEQLLKELGRSSFCFFFFFRKKKKKWGLG